MIPHRKSKHKTNRHQKTIHKTIKNPQNKEKIEK